MNNFKRIPEHGWLTGVCAGMAYSVEVETWIIRLSTVLLCFIFGPFALLVYILLWLFAPSYDETPSDYEYKCGKP